MTPAALGYYAPGDVHDALDALASAPAGGARILAGGQSLVPELARRTSRPGLLVDILRCTDLPALDISPDTVALGPRLRQASAERSQALYAACGLLREALAFVAVPQVRSRATVLGSLAQALPGGELPVVALALDGLVEVLALGEPPHWITAEALFTPEAGTILRPGQLLRTFRFEALMPHEGWAFEEIQLRRAHVALLCVAATVSLASDGSLGRVRVAIGGLNRNPYRATSAESMLQGQSPRDAGLIAAASARAADEAAHPPREDLHATAAYRHVCCSVLVRRALERAIGRAGISHHTAELTP
jgi:CO/xanthine dehydrogenase FAD-binding subunit